MMRILILFLSFTAHVHADIEIKPYEMSAEKEDKSTETNSDFNLKAFPSSVVHSVSVISGQYVETDRDYRIVCPVPLQYERSKNSNQYGNGWADNINESVCFKKYKDEKQKHKYHLQYNREFNETLYFGKKYHRHEFDVRFVESDQLEQGFTNFNGDEVSSHNHLRNIKLVYDYKKDPDYVYVELGDGTKKIFKGNGGDWFSIEKIQRPDGNILVRDKEGYKAVNKYGETLGWIKKEYSPKEIIVKGSDGRQSIYKLSDYNFQRNFIATTFTGITYVSRPDGPPVNYNYYGDNELGSLMRTKYLPDSRYTEYLYYTLGEHRWEGKKHKVKNSDPLFRRVKFINAPLGTDPSPRTMYSFWYGKCGSSEGNTTVLDALGRKKIYHYKHNKLTQIDHYDGNNLAYTDRLVWGKEKERENINLKNRIVQDKNGIVLIEKTISYDDAHNPILEVIKGNWRGYGYENLIQELKTEKSYSNDRFNLLVKEQDEEKTVEYTYYPNSNKMASKTIKGHDGIFIRSFYEYDKNGVLSKETIDDGNNYSERRIKKIESNMQGLPVEVCEYYVDEGKEILKSREVNAYSSIGRLIKRELYDADNTLATLEEWGYDDMGNITLEKNALGVVVLRHYDFNGNLVRKEGPLPTQVETYTYDFMNRLIRFDEKIGSLTLSTHYGYDLCGNRTYQIDRMGNKTTYEYNFLNQKIKTTLPDGSLLRSDYDIFGNPVAEWDGEGNKTIRSFTSSNKVYREVFADGSEEKITYDLKGRPIQKIHKNGLITRYERDSLGRVLSVTEEYQGKILSKTSSTYNAFHCLSETDAAGITTFYTYNKAGQKIKEEKKGLVIEYGYDALGRLTHTFTDDLVSIVGYDALNQVIEERLQGIDGNVLSHVKKQYDETGHLTCKSIFSERGWDVESYLYNERGELIEAINAKGEKTLHHYDYTDKGLKHTTVDPKGIRLITYIDYAGRITHYERQNAFGETIQKREFTYDRNQNKIKAIESVYEGTKSTRTVTTLWSYDNCNRLVSLTDGAATPEQKKTAYVYNAYGQKSALIKPDGVSLNYTYDGLGRQVQIQSSDGTINQSFVYDALNQVVECKDDRHHIVRKYDGTELIEERLNEDVLQYVYDDYGRLLTLTYPDQSQTHYTYKNGRIDSVLRNGNKTSYSYALNGKPETITHFDNTKTRIAYDALNRIIQINAPDFSEELAYDEVGNLIKQNKKSFSYDALSQITSEDKSSYSYDSRYNCTNRNGIRQSFNTLDELQSSNYTYDRNGNLTRDCDKTYRYDALDRLIEARTSSALVTYTYDPFNRRLTANDTRFLYQGNNEIGSISSTQYTLRVLGVGNGAENSAATLFELNGETYLPVHDHLGSLVRLIKNGKTLESHVYSAFGESNTPSLSPWRFSSKRLDPETNLIYFGRRYYNSTLMRWLTCDPKGYDGGPNLYAYCLNAPLSHIDLYGLVGIGTGFDSSWFFQKISSFGRNLIRMPGLGLELIGQHFIPIPLVRDAVEYSGHVLAGRGLTSYTPSYKRDHTEVVIFGGTTDGKSTDIRVNGINTRHNQMVEQARDIQAKNGGREVRFIYNGSKGFLTDLLECGLCKLGIMVGPEKAFVDQINEISKIYGPGHTFFVTAHSQGGLLVGNALPKLSSDVRNNMHVSTMGSASIISNDKGLASVSNYVSMTDIVPMTDPWGYAKALMGKSNVTFMKPQTWVVPDHMYDGNTYTEARELIDERYKQIRKNL